jgi:hypothetical protein
LLHGVFTIGTSGIVGCLVSVVMLISLIPMPGGSLSVSMFRQEFARLYVLRLVIALTLLTD